jgi:rubredoxin
MKCTLCGYRFREEEGKAACRGCPLAAACNKVKCPNCGFDVPVEPGLVKLFKAWRRQK